MSQTVILTGSAPIDKVNMIDQIEVKFVDNGILLHEFNENVQDREEPKMEWMELVSSYEPANPSALTFYDQLRMFLDEYRFYIIFVELFVVYYLGFATRVRMPILKTVLLVAVMLIGAVIFTILDVQLPVKSAMFVALVILVIVRLRSTPKKRGNPE